MKNLLDAADSAYLKKTHILSNKASYNYTVKVPHEQITKTYQNLTKTINIHYSETSPTMGGGWKVLGKEKYNIYENIYILCTAPEVQNAVKQLIISKVGLDTIEVPKQRIFISDGIIDYQFDSSGNKIPSKSQPEAFNGYLRFFYKVNGEVTHKQVIYSDETRFDEEKYNRDLIRADQEIVDCQSRIEHLLVSNQRRIDQLKLDLSITEEAIDSLQKKLDGFYQQYNIKSIAHEKLSSELLIQNNNKPLSEVLNLQKQEILKNENLLQQKMEELTKSEEQLTESQQKLKLKIESLSMQQRAYIFAEIYDLPEEKFMIKLIEKAGFDKDSLAFYGINKNSEALIKLALELKVDFASCHCNEKSLLQHLIKAGNQDLINFILSLENQDFAVTLFTAIAQDDIDTLNVILTHNPYLLSSLHQNGYSLLHVAISLNKIDIVKTLIGFDNTIVDIKTSNEESAFNISLRRDAAEITKFLISYVNFQNELKDLLRVDDMELIEKLSTMEIDLKEKQNLMINQALNNEEITGLEKGEVSHTGDVESDNCEW